MPGDRPHDGELFGFDHVTLEIDGIRILDAVDLVVPDRGVTVVVGPSGGGKSSLLRLMNRLEVPTSGVVRFRGVDLAELDPLDLRRRVALVFQRPPLFDGTAVDNLRVARPDLTDADVADLFGRVGLDPGLGGRRARDLSGGEAQRLCLARALATGPEVVLADEPTASLDAAAAAGLEDLARSAADDGIPVVWVTHDPGQAHRLADHRIVIDRGRVVT